MKFCKNKKTKVFFAMCLFAVVPFVSIAKSHDYYVDSSVSKSGDGSMKEPFKTITEAVEKGGSIFVENGKYNENIEMKKSTEIYGKSENGVIISGNIIMNDETKLRDITARGVHTVITVNKDANVEIENCTIKDFGKIGIETIAGKGKIKVLNSKINNGDGKGFYIQRGKKIDLLNNEITDNDEEGIDIRSKVSGEIKNNTITRNKESGIEVVVGSSDLLIENNTIKKNGSSGIATQFYSERDNKGQVNINKNKIEENKKYGLDCNRPQGGSPEKTYWKDSIELMGNNIYANKIKSISDYCNLIDVVDKNEEMDNMIENTLHEDEKNELEKEIEPELTKDENERIKKKEVLERQAKEKKLEEIKSLMEKQEVISLDIEEKFNELEKENEIKVFFMGVSLSKINAIEMKLEEKNSYLEKIDVLMEDITVELEEELFLQENLTNAKNIMHDQKITINSKKRIFNLFDWFKNLF